MLEVVDLPNDPDDTAYWMNVARNPTRLHESERWWIAYGRACGWPLTNLTDGGEGTRGVSKSPEARAAQGARSRRRFESPEARAALSERARKQFESADARAAHGARMREALASPATRAIMSELARSRFESSPEARMLIGARIREGKRKKRRARELHEAMLRAGARHTL